MFFFSHSMLLLLLIKWHIYWYSESFIIFCSKQPTINEVGTDTTRQLEFWYVFNHIEIATMTVTCLSVPSFVAKHSVCCFSILQILQTFFCRSVVLFFFIYIATAYSFVFFSHYEMGKGNCIAVHDAHIREWRKKRGNNNNANVENSKKMTHETMKKTNRLQNNASNKGKKRRMWNRWKYEQCIQDALSFRNYTKIFKLVENKKTQNNFCYKEMEILLNGNGCEISSML